MSAKLLVASIWDWLYLECSSCSWRGSDMIRRGRSISGPYALSICSCEPKSYKVLERKPHPNFPEQDVEPLKLPVVR